MMARRSTPAWLLCVPYGLLIAAVLIGPVIGIAEISFRRHSSSSITGGPFTWANYSRVFDEFYLGILWNTIRLALSATAIATVLAYPLGYVLARSRGAARIAVSFLVTVPLMTSVVVKTFGWYIILGRGGPAS